MKKNLFLALSVAVVLSTATCAFAETNTTNKSTQFEKGERPEKPENEVFGRIKSINATNVTIEVATMKDRPEGNNNGSRPERPEGDKNGSRPERPDGNNNGSRPERPDGDKNGSRPERPDGNNNGMPPQFQGGHKGTPSELGREGFGERNLEDMFTLTGETKTINIANADFNDRFGRGDNNTDTTSKTYKDFSVGDYVMIEATDNTYSTAKFVRKLDMMGHGGMRNGNPPKDNNIQ